MLEVIESAVEQQPSRELTAKEIKAAQTLDARRRLEDKLEEKRLEKMIADYDFE